MSVLSIDINIKGLLPELLKEPIITISDLGFSLMDFYLEILNNYIFLLDIFIIILKKLFNILSVSFFNICFKIISFYLTLSIVFVFSKF